MDDFEEPTAEELAEAAALAKALDTGSAVAPPDDALSAAALLRFSMDSEIGDERLDAILDEVMTTARPVRPQVEARPWWRWFVPATLVTAAAVVALVLMPGVLNPNGPADIALPAPGAGLLQAQAAAAAGSDDALDDAMASYRQEVLQAIEGRYE